MVAAPLTTMKKDSQSKLMWRPEAEQAFEDLKQRLNSLLSRP